MNRHYNIYWYRHKLQPFRNLQIKTITTFNNNKKLAECYQLLDIPVGSKHEVVKQKFLDLAKRYHPDSGSPDADVEKFVAIENAFRYLSRHNQNPSNELVPIEFDIKHTAPQHRQYLEQVTGHGSPAQRQRQGAQARAARAASAVLQHRIDAAAAEEYALLHKSKPKSDKHDIKTKYGFDRLVEDLIQEAFSKGEFNNLRGQGRPLAQQNTNPYVDFTTHKLNEVLINNGFTPEWITMNKEIEEEIGSLTQRMANNLGSVGDANLKADFERTINEINKKIDTYNLIVPLLNKQRFHIQFDKIKENCKTIELSKPLKEEKRGSRPTGSREDVLDLFFKELFSLFSSNKKQKS